jgi:hypothetical protein
VDTDARGELMGRINSHMMTHTNGNINGWVGSGSGSSGGNDDDKYSAVMSAHFNLWNPGNIHIQSHVQHPDTSSFRTL